MVGIWFLTRVFLYGLSALAIGLVILFVFGLLNRALRFIADMFGVEIFDTFDWLAEKVKRAKEKRAQRKIK